MPDAIAYLNGQIIPALDARLPVFDAGVALGATVTEMTRTFRGEPFRLEDHLERLFHSIRYARFAVNVSKDELAAVSRQVVAHNARLLDERQDQGLIQFITAGEVAAYAGFVPEEGRRGAPSWTGPTICVHTFPLHWELWATKMRQGAHLVTPSIRQVPPQCLDPKMKCRSRMHYYLADQEARLVGPDASALLLDTDGNITETSSANFLIVEGGTMVSPTTRNTLSGISRATVMDLAAQLGIAFAERDIQLYHAINADEAFLTSTPYCLMPVTKINGLAIGDGRPGPVFRRLISAWSELVGVDIEKQILEGAAAR